MSAISPKPYKTAMSEYRALCQSLAKDAFDRMMRDVMKPLYLCGERTTGLDTLNPKHEIWSDIFIGDGDTVAWHVAPDRIPSHLTVDRLTDWMRDRLRREPLWIFAD